MTELFWYSQLPEIESDFFTPEAVVSEKLTVSVPKKDNGFFEILEYEFHRAARYKNAVTLIFIKLCNIDKILHEYGQGTANMIMNDIENVIRTNIRNTDRGFIYGKDEYMIILPHTAKTGASQIIQKLQRLIRSYRLSNVKGKELNLAPKFGVASYPNGDGKFIENSLRIQTTN